MTVELNGFEQVQFKNLITAEACRHQIKDCTEQALNLFRKWMEITDPDNNNMCVLSMFIELNKNFNPNLLDCQES